MSRAASPKPRCAISPRPSRGSPRADGSSRSPATMSAPISRPGARASCACRQKGRVVFTAPIAGKAYARHGTDVRHPAHGHRSYPGRGPALFFRPRSAWPLIPRNCSNGFLRLVPRDRRLPQSSPLPAPRHVSNTGASSPRAQILPRRAVHTRQTANIGARTSSSSPMKPGSGCRRRKHAAHGEPLRKLHTADHPYSRRDNPHPTKLVQSAAMAAVGAPRPCYRPHLPPRLLSAGILSDAQCGRT